jgi:hypothetical protein
MKQPTTGQLKKKTQSFHAKIQLLGFILKLGSSGLACWWPEWQLTSSDKRRTKDVQHADMNGQRTQRVEIIILRCKHPEPCGYFQLIRQNNRTVLPERDLF